MRRSQPDLFSFIHKIHAVFLHRGWVIDTPSTNVFADGDILFVRYFVSKASQISALCIDPPCDIDSLPDPIVRDMRYGSQTVHDSDCVLMRGIVDRRLIYHGPRLFRDPRYIGKIDHAILNLKRVTQVRIEFWDTLAIVNTCKRLT